MKKNMNKFGVVCPSDETLKENIRPINSDSWKIRNVDFVSFNFKDDADKRKTYGVIAQQVRARGLEELVHVKEDGTLGVDYISLLILENSRLRDEVNHLEFQISDLRRRVDELSKKDNETNK